MTVSAGTNAIIIGAGHSGLVAAHALKARGIPVRILEARDRVAEPWRSRHPQLQLNIHRKFAALPGLRLTRRDGVFVTRDRIIRHIEDFARRTNAPIEFGTSVSRVQKAQDGWEVETNRGLYRTRHLIIATGREKIPHIPDWPGRDSFRGEIVHSADLGDIRRYLRRKVLVIGAGNSGTDVLNHLAARAGCKVLVSMRHGPAVMPTWVFGFPMHRLAGVLALIPLRPLDALLRMTQRLFYGNLSRYGFGSHALGGATRMATDGTTPALDNGFIKAVKSGRMQIVGETMRFDGAHVHLKDGTTVEPEIVICATGYRSGLEDLVGEFGVLDPAGHPLHPMGERDPDNPGLWFTGYRPIFQGFFHAARLSAERIADNIATDRQSFTALRWPGGKRAELL